MRPAEVCLIRPADIDRSGEVWRYTPHEHKTEHRGRERLVLIGKKGQQILLPFLLRPDDRYCFCPRESEAKRRALQHANRVTPSTYGNAPGTNRKRSPKRRPGERYNSASYLRAIRRGCEAAGIEPWAPNRLRHAFATEVRRLGGIEAVKTLLGHSEIGTSEIYAERDLALAADLMVRMG
jgi:integrase